MSFIDDIASFFGYIVRDSEIVPASGASDPSLTAAWQQDNTSPALPAFLRILEQVTQKQGGGHDGAG